MAEPAPASAAAPHPAGQDDQDRAAARARTLTPAARTVHRAVLTAFVTTGGAPHDPAALARRHGAEPAAVFTELYEHDLVHLAGFVRES